MNLWRLHTWSLAVEFWVYQITFVVNLVKRILMLHPVLSQENCCMPTRPLIGFASCGDRSTSWNWGNPIATIVVMPIFSGLLCWRHCAPRRSTTRVNSGSLCWKRWEDKRSCINSCWLVRDICSNVRCNYSTHWRFVLLPVSLNGPNLDLKTLNGLPASMCYLTIISTQDRKLLKKIAVKLNHNAPFVVLLLVNLDLKTLNTLPVSMCYLTIYQIRNLLNKIAVNLNQNINAPFVVPDMLLLVKHEING